MSKSHDVIALVGRLLLAVLFVLSGLSKLAAPAAIQGAIAHAGLPLPLVGYLGAVGVELVGGSLLILGFATRPVAAVITAFVLVTALSFHNNFADQNQMIHFLKNIAIMGGLLQLVAFGGGKFSIDGLRAKRKTPLGGVFQAIV